MTTINRHSAGTQIAGQKTGGQFKATERTAAAGDSLTEARAASARALRDECERALLNIGSLSHKLKLAEQHAALMGLSLDARAIHPDAAYVCVSPHDMEDDRFELSGNGSATEAHVLLDRDRNPLPITWEQHDTLSDQVMGSYLDRGYTAAEPLDEYGEVSAIKLIDVKPGDADGLLATYFDDQAFSAVWSGLASAGKLSGRVRTVDDVMEELRDSLSFEHNIEDPDEDRLRALAEEVISDHEDGWWVDSEYQAFKGGTSKATVKYLKGIE